MTRQEGYGWTTGGGKEIGLYRDTRGYLCLRFTTGGEMPPEFDQIFTTHTFAERAANNYLANSKPRKLKNGANSSQ